MTVMHQCGDPVCPDCLCQHHEAAYAETTPTTGPTSTWVKYTFTPSNDVIIQAQIIITERCCVAVNSAVLTVAEVPHINIDIERPIGTIRTTQADSVLSEALHLHHHAAWEVLDPGTYIYYVMNRDHNDIEVYAAWLKIIASDCEG